MVENMMAIMGSRVGQLLICSLLISALFKRAIVRSLAQSLFKKEQMSDCSFRRSLQKSNPSFVTLLKKAIALSLFQRERKSKN